MQAEVVRGADLRAALEIQARMRVKQRQKDVNVEFGANMG